MKGPALKGFFWRLRPTPVAMFALAGGLVVHFLAVTAIRFPEIEDRSGPDRAEAFVEVRWPRAGEAAVWSEQTLLFDSAPLFVPTRWNHASAIDRVASLEEKTGLYSPFIPRLRLDAEGAPVDRLIRHFEPPELDPLHGLVILQGSEGFGEAPSPPARYSQLNPRLRVERLSRSGGAPEVRWFALPETIVEHLPGGLWTSPIFYLDIIQTGLVGAPVLGQGSGLEPFDQSVREYIDGFDFVRRLEPGYHRVTLVP